MTPRQRGRRSYLNRGRGEPFKFKYGTNSISIQKGSKQVISKNNVSSVSSTPSYPKKDDQLYREFIEFLKNKKNDNLFYLKATTEEEESSSSSEFVQTSYEEVITILEPQDVLRYFESGNNPWSLMSKFFGTESYATASYKDRTYYETILLVTGSCEILHFTSKTNPEVYDFSKAVIKQIISIEDWGLNSFMEREFTHPKLHIPIKFNYWDYIDSFYKAFLYENSQRKHTWLFQVCVKGFNKYIPNWFVKWWYSYGPSIQILPEPYKSLYTKWIKITPKVKDAVAKSNGLNEVIPSLYLFTEFSIPWIWKWMPEINYSENTIPCIQRIFFTKFWRKMLQKNPRTRVMYSQETIENIKKDLAYYNEQ